MPYIDDVPVKGPSTCYELPNREYEVISENPGIHCFVWEHFQNVNHVIHQMQKAGGTFSGKKTDLCLTEVVVVGHKCMYEG